LHQGKKQSDVAKILGVTEGYISLVKSRERALTLDHIELLAVALDMPLGEMLIQATERPNAPKKVRAGMDRIAHIIRVGDKALEAIRADKRKKQRRVA